MKVYLFLLFISFARLSEAAESKTCVPYPLKGSFQNSSQVIDFPDGRSLVVVGHAHGARQLIYSKYSLKIIDKSFAQISGPDLQQMLLQINAENSTTVFIYHPFIKSLSSSTTTVNTDALNR